jgi:hypothetical protein
LKTKIYAAIALLSLVLMNNSYASKLDRYSKTLIFNGPINEAAYRQIRMFLEKGGNTIIINSQGGDVKFGQQIGMKMAGKNITLIVDKYCLSSCANYLFLGAKKKFLKPNSILGFHGGVGTKIIESKTIPNAVIQPLNRLIRNEKLFFEKVKVNYEIISSSVLLTRSEISFIDVEIESKSKFKQTFNGDQGELADRLVKESLEADPKAKFSMTFRNEIENSVYFPNKETLLKNGVRGIEEYPYPKNQIELDEIVKRIDKDLKVVGEFSSAESKQE